MPHTKTTLLSVIIVSFNTPKLIIDCLNSVIRDISNSKLLDNKTEVIVVDNNSNDDSVAIIKEFFDKQNKEEIDIKLIQNKQNLGFARANNLALKQARGEYFLLLNSDTIVHAGSLEHLVNNLVWARNHTRVGLLASRLENKDGSSQHQGGSLPSLWTVKNHMFMCSKIPLLKHLFCSTQFQPNWKKDSFSTPFGQIVTSGWVGGTSLLISRDVYQKVGGLDENIFMYGEDVEYCLRAKKAGFLCAIDKSSPVTHLGSASSSSSKALIGEMLGLLYVFKIHKPSWQLPFVFWLLSAGCYLRIILFGWLGLDKEKATAYRQAVSSLKTKYNKLTAK